MEKVFRDLDDFFSIDNCLALLLMREGEKPGILIMSANYDQKEKIEEICNAKSWNWRVYGDSIEKQGLFNSLKRFLGFSNENPFETSGIFVAPGQERFGILESSSGDFYGSSEEAVGRFLGYDEEAVDFYTNLKDGETATEPYEDKVEEMLDSGELEPGDLKYLELVFYVPPPERESILEARDKGRRRWDILSQLEEGERYLKELEQQL